MERLQKVIASSGFCSRRKAEEYITKGKVKVNGIVVTELGIKVNLNDSIVIDGNVLNQEDKEYILLYKPRGVVTTTSDDKNRKTVIDLIKTDKRLYPVGRLDYDTTGVLILTNDGKLANILTHPKQNVDKQYLVKVNGIFTSREAKVMSQGVIIDNFKTSKSRINVKKVDKKNNVSFVEVTIHEGKNHQVKKMFEALGYEVIKLKRERFAFLTLDGLTSGEYRHLTVKEIKKLYSLSQVIEKTKKDN